MQINNLQKGKVTFDERKATKGWNQRREKKKDREGILSLSLFCSFIKFSSRFVLFFGEGKSQTGNVSVSLCSLLFVFSLSLQERRKKEHKENEGDISKKLCFEAILTKVNQEKPFFYHFLLKKKNKFSKRRRDWASQKEKQWRRRKEKMIKQELGTQKGEFHLSVLLLRISLLSPLSFYSKSFLSFKKSF